MSPLLNISHELLHCIFTEVGPADLAALSESCRALYSYIHGNRLLHKDLYLKRYDEPTCLDSEPDWEEEIHRLVKLEKLLGSEDVDVKRDHLDFVGNHVQSLIRTANPDQEESLNVRLLDAAFQNTDNMDAFLCSSSLFARAGIKFQKPAATEPLRQLSAKLHCLYGVPIDSILGQSFFSLSRPQPSWNPSPCTRSHARPVITHPYARSKVYDLREYTDKTLWGPFMADGSHRVDWEKVEAVMIDLGFNLRKFTDRSEGRFPLLWEDPFIGATPNSYSGPPRKQPTEDMDEDQMQLHERALSLDARDPYGISGTWMRIVCFLDYHDLYAFNFDEDDIPKDQLREPIDTEEGMIKVREYVCMTTG